MAFFTTSPVFAENWLNPSVTGQKTTLPGAGMLSASPNLNPTQQNPYQMWNMQQGQTPASYGVQQQTNWGAPTTYQNPFMNTTMGYNPYQPWYAGYQPQQQEFIPASIFQEMNLQPIGTGSGGDNSFGPTSTAPQLSAWEQATQMANMPDWQKGLMSVIPGGGLMMGLANYQAGINPFAAGINEMNNALGLGMDYTPTYTDSYGGAGAGIAGAYGIGAGEQRDMLVEQEKDFWDSQAEEAAWNASNGGSTADTGGITSYSDGSASYTSDATGTVSGTDYGGGSYGFDSGASGAYGGAGEEVGYESPGGDDSGGGDSGGGGGSYIATAATQALGEKGLKVFEDWRDYMFTVLPTFTSSFGRYRATAPKIVAEIDKKENSKNIYSWIWDMHLKPIFDMISKDKDSDKALKDYKIMVRELSNKFLAKEKV